MKQATTVLTLLILTLLVAISAFGQTTYTWNQTGTSSWATAANWTPTRTTPATTDILVFNNGANTTVTSVPSETDGKIQISGNTTVNLQGGTSGNTLTLSGGASALSVASGSGLNVNGANILNIAIATGSTGSVSGSMTFSTVANTITAADASGLTFNSGAVFTQNIGNSGNIFGSTGTAGTVVFASGSSFVQYAGSNPFGLGQPSSKVVFNSGSLFKIKQNSAPSFSGRTYGNLEIDTTNFNQNATGTAALVMNNLTITRGILNLNLTGPDTIRGSISVATGMKLGYSPASAASLVFAGTSDQTITRGTNASLTFGSSLGFVVSNTSGTVAFAAADTIGGTTTVNSGGILATAGTLTANGAVTLNGTFQLNQGGWATGSGTWTYGSSGTLNFNNSSGSYGVNTDVWWPSSNGPVNVTVAGAGGITMNVARTVSGTFLMSAVVTTGSNLTLNGTTQINGGNFSSSPTYGSSSTLIYNTTYGVFNEWGTGTSVGSGVPKNITVQGNSTLTLTTTDRYIPGDLNIASGSSLTLNGTSGDLHINGNWTNAGTFTSSGRAVWFEGSGAQSITNANGENFSYLLINKSGGTLTLANNATVTFTTGDGLQLLNTGGFDLNGKTLTLAGAGGNIKASGAARTIAGTGGGTIAVTGSKTVISASTGTLVLPSTVTVLLTAGIDFGTSLTTLNGTLQINAGGFLSNNSPAYGSASLLKYNTGGTFGRTAEWASSPANVQISNNTALNYPNGVSITKTMTGNLTIDAGSALYMDFGSPNPGVGTLTVGGNVTLDGNLSLGNLPGGDLKVGGNWTRTGILTTNGRLVEFNGASAQTLTGATTFDYLTINNSTGLTLNNNAIVNTALTFTVGKITTGSNAVVLNSAAGVSGAGSGKYVLGNLTYNTAASGTPTVNFAVGDASNYTPVSVTINSISAAGSLTAKTTAGAHPQIGSATSINSSKSVSRYWTLTNSGTTFTDYSATFNFVAGDKTGSPDTSKFIVGKYNGSTWSYPAVGSKLATSTQVTGVTSFSDFAIGEQQTYTITATAAANGTISPTGITTVNAGATQGYTIAANTGYQIDSVVVDGVNQGAVTTYNFTNVVANHTINSYYSILSYTIASSAGANGSISPNGNTSVTYNGTQAYTITPNTGYHIDSVIVDGSAAAASSPYTFSNVTAAHTIRAVFAINTYTLTASSGSNGSVTPSGVTTVNYNGSQSYTITPNTGYHIDSVIVDGSYVGNTSPYNFTNVTANHTISATFAINTYTLTASAGANGSISPTGVTTVNYNAGQAYTITADGGYHIDTILVDGAYAGNTSPYTFSNVTANHTISVTFAADAATITATAGANGSISPSGAVGVSNGANQAFTFTPNTGYHIDSVVVDGSYAGNSSPYTFTSVTANHTISVSFAINTYSVTSSAGANGSISPNGSTSVNHGGSQAYTITPNTDYHIDSILVDGSYAGNTSPYTFTNVTANHTISATFAHDSVTVTASAGANGSVSPSGSVKVAYSGSQSFTFTGNTGYHLDSIFVDGSYVSSSSPYNLTGVTASHTVSATFAINTYSIVSSAGSNGSISPNGSTSVNHGGSQAYTITPNTDYYIDSILVDGAYAGNTTPYTFSNVTSGHTISATFAHDSVTVTASAGANGSVSPSGSVNVAYNGSKSFTFTANSGYHLDSVFVDGGYVGGASPYTLTNVTAPHTVSATFAINTYTITASSGANGSVTPTGATTVNSGGSQQYTITADSHYHIDSILVDGSYVGNTSPYTISSVTTNHTISATFAIDTYTLTATTPSNGSISPSGTVSVNWNGSQQYTFTANANYRLDSIFVDGSYVGNTSPYTVSNVSANHTISATFAITTYSISVSAGAHGSISPAGPSVTVNSSANQAFTISANSGYHIGSVLVDASSQGAIASYTFTNVTANHSISATFVSDTTAAGVLVNGAVAAGEYGNDSDGQNQQTNGAVVWHATWDSLGLYIGITGANTAEGAVIYLDKNPLTPIDSGSNIDGTNAGQNYDGVNFASLPFRADLVTYVKNGYREYRTANGSNGWTTATSGYGSYSDNGSNVREVAIPWSAIGGEPASFAFYGFVTSSGGFVYGQVPTENGSGTIGTTARYGRYYIVNTTNGTVKPFNHNSYVFNSASDITNFGTISVYDFTMNTSGRSITRSTGGSNAWTVTGNMLVNAGTIDFGAATTSATVTGDVTVSNGATLKLSSAVGGDLHVAGTFTKGASGTFTHNSRSVEFNGTSAQTVAGSTTFGYLTVNNAAGVTLSSSDTVANTLTFTSGMLNTGANTLALTSSGAVSGAAAGKYVNGNVSYAFPSSGSVSFTYPVGDATNYTPVALSINSLTASGAVAVNTTSGAHPNLGTAAGLNSSKSVNRYWTVNNSGATFSNYSATFNFVNADLNGSPNTSNLAIGKYSGGTWTYPALGTRTATSTQVTGLTSFSDFAIAEPSTKTITASAGANGSISPSGATAVNYGASQSFTVTPNTGYAIDSIFVDGVYSGNTSPYNFSNVTADHTISATFVAVNYTITASAGTNGSISPSGAVSVAAGANQQFDITPNGGYHIDSIMVDGGYVGNTTPYTFTNVQAAHTISVTFAVNAYVVSASAGAHGSITPSGTLNANSGDAKHFTIAPNTGYHIDSVIVDGAKVDSTTSYTFTNITANHSIRATFAIDSMTITATAGSNGSVSPSGSVTLAYGSNQSFTFTPAAHYHVDSVLVDGAYAGAGTSYAFTNVTANQTVSVKFAIDTYTITATAGSNGSVAPSGVTTVSYGASQSVTVTANALYHIDSIYVDGAYAGTTSPVNFTNISANHTVSAVFKLDTNPAGITFDGSIGAGEYGADVNGQNQETSGGTVWHMTWDSTALYIGISGANTAEGAVVYLDKNPQVPINSGTDAEGTIVGQNYDGANFASLQFRADLVTYFKNGYREYRTANGSNGWSGATAGAGSYGDNASNTREVSIPWSAIGGKPASFAFFGYVTSGGGFVYGQVPAENVGGPIGTSARFGRYYVVSTTDGSVKPYSRNSYVYNNVVDLTGFGAISVYDFTMNSAGRTITRSAGAGGAWSVAGNMLVNAGTIDFGASATSVTVNGNTTVGAAGTVSLSSVAGGDFNAKGNVINSGTINTNNRAIGFTGTSAQTATGVTTADYLSLNNAAGLTVANSLTVNQTLTLTNGALHTGVNTVTIGSGGSVARTAGYVHGKLEKPVAVGAPVTTTFEVGDGSAYAPATVVFNSVATPGSIVASTTPTAHPNVAGTDFISGKKVNRYWTLTNNGTLFDSYSATFNYVAGDIDAGADTAAFAVRKYDSPTWSSPLTGTRRATSTQALGMTSFSDFAVGQVPSYTITASAGSNGSITPSGTVTVPSGENATFAITANGGYHIDSVIVDGAFTGSAATYTFTGVTANHTIRAVFAVTPPNTHVITASAGSNGTISPSGAVVVNDAANQTFNFTPATGYHVATVTVDGGSVAAGPSYTFTNVTVNHTINVTFAIDVFTITATAGSNGTLSPSGAVSANYGSNKTFSIHANAGFHIDSVIVDGAAQAVDTTYTFTNIIANHTIRTVYRVTQFTITAFAGSNGSISPSGAVAVNSGANQLFTISPASGYHLDSLIVDGVKQTNAATYTFTNVTAAHTIRVTFAVNTFTITTIAGANGSITPGGPVTVNQGANQTFVFHPASGYIVDSVIVDNSPVAVVDSFTFTNVIANHSIRVKFAQPSFTVTATAGSNGSITPSGVVSVSTGSNRSFTFSPSTGYHVDSVIVDGVKVDSTVGYTFISVSASHTIRVTFAINTYTITATAGANGTVTPSGSVSVNYGANQSFVITASSGYVIDSVAVDGASIGASGTYTFTNVTANHSITAAFKVSPAYDVKYRTFMYDSLAVKKAIAKKAVTEFWRFNIINTTAGYLTEVNVSFKNDAASILSMNHGFAATGEKKAWKLSGGSLAAGETLIVTGRSPKAKVQSIAKLYLGALDKTPDLKGLAPAYDVAELPMPNAASIRNAAFALAGFSKASPLVIGVAKTDSPSTYGWVNLGKGDDMYKSLEDKSGRHTHIGNGFALLNGKDFKKAQTSLPPSKHDDKTFADLLTLKFNIVLSQLGVTQRGLGELRYSVSSSPFNGMLLTELARQGDTMMTFHGKFGSSDYVSLDSALVAINAAFSGAIDTTSWGDSLRLTGVTKLIKAPFLTVSGLAASRIEARSAAEVDAALAAEVPMEMKLEQNYPNPFNPTTNIRFTLPNDATVSLVVYNMLGQEVARLASNELMDAGEQEVTFNASNLASGVYFYRLTASEENLETGVSSVITDVKKMMLIR